MHQYLEQDRMKKYRDCDHSPNIYVEHVICTVVHSQYNYHYITIGGETKL